MKTKKLTEAQTSVLQLLSDKDSADFYDVLRVGANGSTTVKLVTLRLVALHQDAGKLWCITQAGREALSAGRYVAS